MGDIIILILTILASYHLGSLMAYRKIRQIMGDVDVEDLADAEFISFDKEFSDRKRAVLEGVNRTILKIKYYHEQNEEISLNKVLNELEQEIEKEYSLYE